MPAKSPNEEAAGVISLHIAVNGRAISDTLQALSVRIESDINRPSRALLEFLADGAEDEEKHTCAALADWVGGAIEISAGYDGHLTQVFAGVVRKLRIESAAASDVAPRLAVEASDAMADLEGMPGYRAFSYCKNSDIFALIVGSIGARSDATSSTVEYQQVVQSGLPDLEFLLSRAERSGTYLTCQDGKTIAWKALELEPSAAISLTEGQDMLGFAGHVGAARWSSVLVRDWNVADKAALEMVADVPGGGKGVQLAVRRAVESAEEGQELAKAYAMRIALSMQEGGGIARARRCSRWAAASRCTAPASSTRPTSSRGWCTS